MKQLDYTPQRTSQIHPISRERRRAEAALEDLNFWRGMSGTLVVVINIAVIFLCNV